MLKPSVLNILLFWVVKYILFYVLKMFKSSNYAVIGFRELKSNEDWFYYLWIFLFLPIACFLIFTAPLFFTFRIKNPIYFTLAILSLIIVEYLLYTWLASQASLINGVYNGILTVLVLLLFFFKRIKIVYQ